MEGTRDKQVSKGEIEETYIHGKGSRGSYGRGKGQGTIKGQSRDIQIKEVRGKGQGGQGKGRGSCGRDKGQARGKRQGAHGVYVWVG
jgi:hypothetical protein